MAKAGVNGVAGRLTGLEAGVSLPLGSSQGKRSGVKAVKREATPRKPKGADVTARRLAWGVAGVATSLLALSLSHCAEALSTLTGMPGWQAWALAIGIDAGMLASEAAVIAGKRAGNCVRWASGYVIGACIASAILNAYASVSHAPSGLGAVLAGCIGAAIPAGVYALGRVCGSNWK